MSHDSENNMTEHRQEYRLKDEAIVFIELAAESPDGDRVEILISNSVDISANGLQISSNQQLPASNIYQAAIQLPDRNERIPLTVQVRWCRFSEENNNYYIGLEVLNDIDSQLADWKIDISQRLIDDFDEE